MMKCKKCGKELEMIYMGGINYYFCDCNGEVIHPDSLKNDK